MKYALELSCLETESDQKQILEEAKEKAEFYKFKCNNKEELDEFRQGEKELLYELKRAKTRAKLYQRLTELLDAELRLLLDEDEPRRHAPVAGVVEEAFGNRDEITCGPETGHPTAVCIRCLDEEACVMMLPSTISASAWRANGDRQVSQLLRNKVRMVLA